MVNGHKICNGQKIQPPFKCSKWALNYKCPNKGCGDRSSNGSKIMATKIMAIMKWGKGLLYAINLDHVHRLCSVDPDKIPESRITVESYDGFHAHYC